MAFGIRDSTNSGSQVGGQHPDNRLRQPSLWPGWPPRKATTAGRPTTLPFPESQSPSTFLSLYGLILWTWSFLFLSLSRPGKHALDDTSVSHSFIRWIWILGWRTGFIWKKMERGLCWGGIDGYGTCMPGGTDEGWEEVFMICFAFLSCFLFFFF